MGNWSSWPTDLFGKGTGNSIKDDQLVDGDDSGRSGDTETKSYCLLSKLSDLIMLPNDMLLDKIRLSTALHPTSQVLRNFMPDEFCSDHISGVFLGDLKYQMGNWSNWLTDLFGMDTHNSVKDDHFVYGDGACCLLNKLRDLSMLAKDMLLDRAIINEVCPSIGLYLISAVPYNFMLDKICPDHISGVFLCDLKYQEKTGSSSGRLLRRKCISSPSSYVAEVANASRTELDRRASVIQRKYLEDLDSSLSNHRRNSRVILILLDAR